VATDIPQTGNGKDENAPDAAPRKARAVERPTPRAKSAPREPAVNAIEASRKPRRHQNSPVEAAPTEGAAPSAASSTATAAALQRADTDPWTVPQSVRDRFVQDGHRFFFPDGAPAFKDLGRRLTTASENTQVVHSLIQIANSRGWTEVTVTGTERFRQEAWRQARLAGLGVRGYRPSEAEIFCAPPSASIPSPQTAVRPPRRPRNALRGRPHPALKRASASSGSFSITAGMLTDMIRTRSPPIS
jgi:hypothetical protein